MAGNPFQRQQSEHCRETLWNSDVRLRLRIFQKSRAIINLRWLKAENVSLVTILISDWMAVAAIDGGGTPRFSASASFFFLYFFFFFFFFFWSRHNNEWRQSTRKKSSQLKGRNAKKATSGAGALSHQQISSHRDRENVKEFQSRTIKFSISSSLCQCVSVCVKHLLSIAF